MKYLSLFFLFFAFAKTTLAQVQSDVVFKSRFDLESSQSFIKELRIFLKNNDFSDPYSQEFEKPIVIDLKETINNLPSTTQKWIKELQSLFRVQLFESEYRIIIEKLSYSLQEFNAEFLPGLPDNQRVEYVTVNYVNGLHLKAEKITFEVELKHTQNHQPIKFKIDLVKPEFIIGQELQAELPMGWSTSILPGNILLTLESIDISKIMQKILQNPHLINFKIEKLNIPEISLKVGSKKIKFDQQKIEDFFVNRKDVMKKGILDVLDAEFRENFSNLIDGEPKELLLPKEYGIDGEFKGQIDIQNMDVNNTGIVQFDFDGRFCKKDAALLENICHAKDIEVKLRRKISLEMYQKSLREINRSLIEKKTNVAFSVSEDYLNQLIGMTINLGLWKKIFEGKTFSLGPETAFVLADEKGELFSLYLDIIYKLKPKQRILVGRSTLRFPIKLMIALNVHQVEGIPRFTIKVQKVAIDNKLLHDGAPHYDLPSTVNSVPRFKAKVMKGIMKEVSSLEGKTLVNFELNELKGTYLDQLKFFSDGLGRGTATIGFKK